MQPKLMHRDETAWEKGDFAYDLDDTIETGILKAEQYGIRPGSNGYAAFITAFSRRVRSKQISALKARLMESEAAAAAAAAATKMAAAETVAIAN